MKKDEQADQLSNIRRVVDAVKVIVGVGMLFIGAQLLGGVLIGLILLGFGIEPSSIDDSIKNSAGIQFGVILLVEALAVAGVWIVVQFYDRNLFKVFGLVRPNRRIFWQVVKTFLLYLFVTWLTTVAVSNVLPKIDVNMEQDIGFKGASGWQLLPVFLGLCVAVPIGEELMFRGLLFRGLKKYLQFLPAAVITSMLFGIAHLEFIGGKPLNWAAAVDTTILSIFLIKVYERTGKITAPIMLHALKNSLAFVFLFVLK